LSWKIYPPRPNGTGYCVIDDDGRVVELGTVTTDQEVIGLVGTGDVWLGIDAPLRAMPGRSMRTCERMVLSRGIRILPTELGFHHRHYGGCRGAIIAKSLEARGLEYFGQGGKALFEVYPRAVLRALGPLPLSYKKGPRSDRLVAADHALRRLGEWEPSIEIPPRFMPGLRDGKEMADRMDALLAAASLYRHRLYSGKRSMVLGEDDDGYILLPQ
jgi:predicted nuclease with RNAse H fold